jgi:hypothetical protein
MQQIELYINDVQCVLGEDEIVMSYATNKLQDIASRQGNYSNTFKIPMCNTNRLALGMVHQGTVIPTLFNSVVTARVLVNGAEEISGFAVVNTTKEDIELTIFSGNSDWITDIGDKAMNELNVSDLDHIYNSDNIESNRLNTYVNGFVYPNIYYGAWVDFSTRWKPTDFFPALFDYRLVKQIFTDIGKNVAGSLFENANFRKKIYCHHQATWFNKFRLLVETTVREKTTLAISSVNTFIGQNAVTSNGAYLGINDWGTSPTTFYAGANTYLINGKLKFTVDLADMPGDTSVSIDVYDYLPAIFPSPAVETLIGNIVSSTVVPGVNTIDISNVEFTFGNNAILRHYMAFKLKFHGTTIKNTSGFFKVELKDPAVFYGAKTTLSTILSSELKQAEYLKDIFVRYGIIATYDKESNTVYLNEFNKLTANKYKAVDLSDQIDKSESIEIQHSLSGYGQNNFIRNKNDENDANVSNSKYGDTVIKINNVNLPNNINQYESPLAALRRVDVDSKTVASIPIRQAEGTSFDPSKNKTLKPKAAYTYQTSQNLITQDGQSAPSYSSEVYFETPENLTADISMTWDYLLNKLSPEILNVIQTNRLYKILIRLRRQQVINLDFSIPVYIDSTINGTHISGYFYINLIDQYKPGSGEPCYIELLPID